MGIGEPLDNRANVLRFLQLVNHPEGLNIGMRHISLSTCGVVPGIDALAEENLQLTLSVSLHAPDERDAQPHHAGQQRLRRGGAVRRLPPLFQENRPPHLALSTR